MTEETGHYDGWSSVRPVHHAAPIHEKFWVSTREITRSTVGRTNDPVRDEEMKGTLYARDLPARETPHLIRLLVSPRAKRPRD